ncbi:MAG: DUF1697 domain-containing protein [Woeseiaceae bacterium]|nr:DUF1697 domain-containing protein [Woeseiaceae bacterium]
MTIYVALFRGINVGGKHILPMQDLRELLAELGCEDIQTYIQSGNAVFSSADPISLSAKITSTIEERFGFAPQVLLLTVERLAAIASENPYPEAEATPKLLHVWFLTEKAGNPDIDAMNSIKAENERFTLTDDALYLHAPDGIGRSRLAAKIDRHLGVSTTARNWRTVMKLLDLAKS